MPTRRPSSTDRDQNRIEHGPAARPSAPGLSWDSHSALLGAAYAIPAALLVFNRPAQGFAMAVGVIPVATAGLAPTRHARRVTALLGAFVGVPIVVGAVLANVPWIAVVGMLLLGVGAVSLTRRRARAGQVLTTLGLPMVGVGFSYADDLGTAVAAAGLMVVGSLYAYLISLLWPESSTPPPPPPATPQPAVDYGVRLGLAAATAALIGFALDLDHVGWACAAALLVMRPSAEMQRLRSIGRIVSVTLGAIVGVLVVTAQPPTAAYSALMIVTVALLTALRRSRWYITPAFTTLLVFLLLLSSDPATARYRFGERVGETILGVALAYLFGLVAPKLVRRGAREASVDPGDGCRGTGTSLCRRAPHWVTGSWTRSGNPDFRTPRRVITLRWSRPVTSRWRSAWRP